MVALNFEICGEKQSVLWGGWMGGVVNGEWIVRQKWDLSAL